MKQLMKMSMQTMVMILSLFTLVACGTNSEDGRTSLLESGFESALRSANGESTREEKSDERSDEEVERRSERQQAKEQRRAKPTESSESVHTKPEANEEEEQTGQSKPAEENEKEASDETEEVNDYAEHYAAMKPAFEETIYEPVYVRPEICNGIDDDEDGSIDEGVKNVCGACGDVIDFDANGTPDCQQEFVDILTSGPSQQKIDLTFAIFESGENKQALQENVLEKVEALFANENHVDKQSQYNVRLYWAENLYCMASTICSNLTVSDAANKFMRTYLQVEERDLFVIVHDATSSASAQQYETVEGLTFLVTQDSDDEFLGKLESAMAKSILDESGVEGFYQDHSLASGTFSFENFSYDFLENSSAMEFRADTNFSERWIQTQSLDGDTVEVQSVMEKRLFLPYVISNGDHVHRDGFKVEGDSLIQTYHKYEGNYSSYTKTFVPAVKRLDLPLTTGKTWVQDIVTYVDGAEHQFYKRTVKVLGDASVQTNDGDIATIKIRVTKNYGGFSKSHFEWWSPELGLIKTEESSGNALHIPDSLRLKRILP